MKDPSLISQMDAAEVAESRQPMLFASHEIEEAMQAEEQKGNYTGERLMQRRPEIYREVVRLIAEPGVSDRLIARVCKVSDRTIAAIREREQIPIAAQKTAISNNIRMGLRMVTERVVELAPSMSAKDALIGVGILTEKMQLLDGEATQRSEVLARPASSPVEDFEKYIDSLPSAAAKPMGFVGERGEQRGSDLAGDLAADTGAAGVADDAESVDPDTDYREVTGTDTVYDTEDTP